MTQQNETFTFDLERMKKAVDAKSHKLPDSISSLEEFDEWLSSIDIESENNE